LVTAQQHPEHDLAERLAMVPLFSGLPAEFLRLLAHAAVSRQYEADQLVFVEGEASPGLFVIESGHVKVVRASPQGREHTLEVLGPSQPANAVAVFIRRPSPATAIALEPTRGWLLPREAVAQLIRDHPAFAVSVIENMADHMVRLVDLVADLSLRSVTERLAKLLLDEAVDGVLVRPRWLTLPELAARLGTVPDVVQRALGRLTADGLVETDRREIRIRDRERLEALAS